MLVGEFAKTRDALVFESAKKHLAGKKILEVGCGEGDRTKLFYSVSNQVFGIDIVNKVEEGHKNHFRFVLGDVTILMEIPPKIGNIRKPEDSIDKLTKCLKLYRLLASILKVEILDRSQDIGKLADSIYQKCTTLIMGSRKNRKAI